MGKHGKNLFAERLAFGLTTKKDAVRFSLRENDRSALSFAATY